MSSRILHKEILIVIHGTRLGAFSETIRCTGREGHVSATRNETFERTCLKGAQKNFQTNVLKIGKKLEQILALNKK